ncbi:hypothetical protein PMAYCL1PPCAC_31225 [Pristionchus mayeri]|uniref:F-box domain-containing protein n=1 Tax=Pristionchus mayeri TaxID=1317129 RepID=A0AAN5DFD3_9BILA|nr:hypothetical protein PMAYCL1PPCAC_31225 [Pristionchus mayeri]
MPLCHNVLDSGSDEEIGWSRTLDLPRSRHTRRLEERRRAAIEAASQPGTSNSPSTILVGPGAKRIKLEVRDVEENEKEEDRRQSIVHWPSELLKMLIKYVPIDDRIKMRCTCKTLRDLVDGEKRMITHELCIKRLDEAEIGLYLPQYKKEGRFVIHNKNFTWTERPLLRTIPEMRRGMVNWTRHHRTRMGRIRTAIKAIFKISWILRINVEQVNLSNSFIRDLYRVMAGNIIYALDLQVQMFEQDRPDLMLLDGMPCKSLGLSIRLREREPLPHIERFLNEAIHKFRQIIIDVRQDSWKFKSSVHYRKSYEEYGINDAALMQYMTGDACNFLRLKVICRYVTRDGLISAILYLRTRDMNLPSRGFCVIVHRDLTKSLLADVKALPLFGRPLKAVNSYKGNLDGYKYHETEDEFLEVRNVKQDMGKTPLTEIRYYRKGNDDNEEYMGRRCDDEINWDPFEQPKFIFRPS